MYRKIRIFSRFFKNSIPIAGPPPQNPSNRIQTICKISKIKITNHEIWIKNQTLIEIKNKKQQKPSRTRSQCQISLKTETGTRDSGSDRHFSGYFSSIFLRRRRIPPLLFFLFSANRIEQNTDKATKLDSNCGRRDYERLKKKNFFFFFFFKERIDDPRKQEERKGSRECLSELQPYKPAPPRDFWPSDIPSRATAQMNWL